MMEATDFAKRDDPAGLPEREMRSCAVIVREVRGQDATEVLLAENDDIVEALVPQRADKAFHERILPRAARRREDFRDARALDTMAERLAEDSVAIAEKIARPWVVREGLQICWAVHCAVGCSVTLKWTTRRRW
jgi:hypothetical protein